MYGNTHSTIHPSIHVLIHKLAKLYIQIRLLLHQSFQSIIHPSTHPSTYHSLSHLPTLLFTRPQEASPHTTNLFSTMASTMSTMNKRKTGMLFVFLFLFSLLYFFFINIFFVFLFYYYYLIIIIFSTHPLAPSDHQLHEVLHRMPFLQEIKVKTLKTGSESFTPDGKPIIGRAPDVGGVIGFRGL